MRKDGDDGLPQGLADSLSPGHYLWLGDFGKGRRNRPDLAHGMARPLGAYFHVPHGLANAIVLPRAMEFTRVAAPDKFAQIARAMGEEITNFSSVQAAQKAVESVKTLCSDIQVPRLSDLGIKKEEYEKVIVQMAQDGLASGTPQANPRVPTEKEMIELFKLVYD